MQLSCIVVQPLSCFQLFSTLWTAVCQAPLFSTVSQSLLKFMAIASVMLSNHLILWCPLLLLPSIFSSIRSFPVSWLLVSSGPSVGASASASVFPVNIQGWFPLGLTGLICLQSKGLSRVFSSTTVVVLLLSCVRLFATVWTVACQASLSMDFPG